MTDPFNLEARYYDRIWGSAERYQSEAESLDQILKDHKVHRVLDLGCGTGGHCLELAKLSYNMVGVDISEAMLEKAKEKFSELGLEGEFVLSDMIEVHSSLQEANVGLPFDAIICMGHSLAHMLDNESLAKALDQIRRVLRKRGLFILWVSNAKHLRDDRMRQVKMDNMISKPELQLVQLCCNFRDDKYEDVLIWNSIWMINDQGRVDFQVRTHPLRWFRYNSLTEMLRNKGFAVLKVYGDALGHEHFDDDKHDTIFMICQKA